ncbi:MAG: BrnA antitoxin family protein [Gemmatimonadota bacterium]|nr:BrnA antitoxin family protein [Gemmatimonadota bacterium]
MKKKPSKKPSRVAERPKQGRANFDRIRRASEREIMQTSPEELADLPADFWDEAVLVIPGPKRAISLRVDEDVLEWFRGLGPRYQTRMNAVLRSYMKRAAPRTRR